MLDFTCFQGSFRLKKGIMRSVDILDFSVRVAFVSFLLTDRVTNGQRHVLPGNLYLTSRK